MLTKQTRYWFMSSFKIFRTMACFMHFHLASGLPKPPLPSDISSSAKARGSRPKRHCHSPTPSATPGWSPADGFQIIMFSTKDNNQRKFRNLTSDYTERCCWRSVQEMWSRRCDTAEMWDMRIWRVGSARNAMFFHSFVASPAGKVSS